MDGTYHQQGYGYPHSNPSQLFPVGDAGWGNQVWTAPYEYPPSTEQADPSTQHEVYAPMLSGIPSASASVGIYLPPAPPTTLTSPENWAPQRSLQPGSMPTHHLPSQMPLQRATPNLPSLSANLAEYAWLPQRQYALTAHHFTPANPILFSADSGEPGIRLSAALNRRFTNLRDRDELVFKSSRSPTITMRLEWPGYASWSRQVRILDSRSVRQSISREKLAYEVAKTVLAFAQPQNAKRVNPEGAPDRDTIWAICEGNISLEDLVLVHVDNVSKGAQSRSSDDD